MFGKSAELTRSCQEMYENFVVMCVDRDRSLNQMRNLLKLLNKGSITSYIFDTETTGVNMFSGQSNYFNKYTQEVEVVDGVRVFMYQFGYQHPTSGKIYCMWTDCEDEEGMEIARKIMAFKKCTVIGHNLKFDYQVCYMDGIEVEGRIWDTLSATCLTHNRLPNHSLKYLIQVLVGNSSGANEEVRWEKESKDWLKKARRLHTAVEKKRFQTELGRLPNKLEKEVIKEYINYSFIPNEIMVKYALLDIWNTFILHLLIEDEIEENYAHTFPLEIKIVYQVISMERRGMYIDKRQCQIGYHRLTTYERILTQKVHVGGRDIGWYDFNPGSHIQMMKYLKEYLEVPDRLLIGKKGKVCTEKEVLLNLVENEGYTKTMLEDIVALRGVQKLRVTYFRNILHRSKGNNVLNPNIKPSETKTGRAASANPALQNIPRPGTLILKNVPSVRSIFITRPGYFNLYMDYSQVEMVVFALFCQDEGLLAAVRAGVDLHLATAELMFGYAVVHENEATEKYYRQRAKALNFGIIYGMGVKALAKTLGITLAAAMKLMRDYMDRFPGIKFIQSIVKELLVSQGFVEDIFGRRYHVEPDKAYVAVNALTQGAAANILKLATVQVQNLINFLQLNKEVCILMPIHDELKIEVKNGVDPLLPYLIKITMEAVKPITVYDIHPNVDIELSTTNWEDKHGIEFNTDMMKKAEKKFKQIEKHVIEPYSDRYVDWFIEEKEFA